MTSHVDEDLAEWSLGLLPSGRQDEVAEHLRECQRCRATAGELQMAVDALAPGPFETRGIWAGVQQQLSGGKRFEHFAAQVAQLFDLPVEEISALLEQLNGTEGWFEGPSPGVEIFPVVSGPNVGEGISAFLRLAPGAEFPTHEHGGREQVLVLQGGYACSTGIEVWRGELDVRQKGTSHSFVALDGVACIAAAVTYAPEN